MNEETVKKIASLAKIEVQKKDLSRLVKELEQIIGWGRTASGSQYKECFADDKRC